MNPITLNVQSVALPVLMGVPIAKSENILSLAGLRVRTPGGSVIARETSMEVLCRWDAEKTNTSAPIMIALVSFKPSGGAGAYKLDNSGAAFTASPITITDNGTSFTINNGAMTLQINKTSSALLQSLVIGTEQLHATNKPQLKVPVAAASSALLAYNTGLPTGFDEPVGAPAGQNKITVDNVIPFTVSQTIKIYFNRPLDSVTPSNIRMKSTQYSPESWYQANTTPERRFIFARGTARQFPAGTLDDTFPTFDFNYYWQPSNEFNRNDGGAYDAQLAALLVDDPVEDFDAWLDNDSNHYTIMAINGSELTLDRNLSKYMIVGATVEITGGPGGGGAEPLFTPTATVIERQLDNYVAIKQTGFFSQSFLPTVEVTLTWHVHKDQPWTRCQVQLNNYSKNTAAPVGDVNIPGLVMEVPTAVAASGSDSILTNAVAITRVQAGTSSVFLSAGSFQMGAPEFAQKWLKEISGDAAGFHYEIFPGTVSLQAARATECEFYLGQSVSTPMTLTWQPTNCTLEPLHVISTRAFRHVTTIAETHTAGQVGGDAELAEAWNEAENHMASLYDVTKTETAGSTPPRSADEWRNVGEFGEQYGWNQFGSFNWGSNVRNYNHYDTQGQALEQFLRTADLKALRIGSECARFQATYGVYQSRFFDGGNPYNQLQGVHRFENEASRGPGFLSHSWFNGLWTYWALTGDQRVYDAVIKSIEGPDQNNVLQPGTLMNWRWAPTGAGSYPGGFAGDGAGDDVFTLQDGERYIGWAIQGLMDAYHFLGRTSILNMAAQYASCFHAGEIAQGSHGWYLPLGFEDDNTPPATESERRKIGFVNFGYVMNGIIDLWAANASTTVRDYISRVGKMIIYGDAQSGTQRNDAPVIQGRTIGANRLVADGADRFWPLAQTTLAAGIGTGDTTLSLTNAAKFVAGAGLTDNNRFAVQEGSTIEYMSYSGRADGSNSLTGVVRALAGSTAQSFTTAAVVYPTPLQPENAPVAGIGIDYLPAVAAAAKISNDPVLIAAAKRIFADTALHRGLAGPALNPADRTFINLRAHGFPASALKIFGQFAFAFRAMLAWLFAQPVPVVTSISPTAKTAGDADFLLTVNDTGARFVNGALVRVNEVARATSFVSASQLTATVTAAEIAAVGALRVTVLNPGPGGGYSNCLPLTVNAPGGAGTGAGAVRHRTQQVFLEEGIQALNDARALGLDSAALGAIASPGTVDKLIAAIAALAVHETLVVLKSPVTRAVDKMRDLEILLDADVETARAAPGDRMETLLNLLRGLRESNNA
jgi:hypothetical protein